jgi:hypothetical protein
LVTTYYLVKHSLKVSYSIFKKLIFIFTLIYSVPLRERHYLLKNFENRVKKFGLVNLPFFIMVDKKSALSWIYDIPFNEQGNLGKYIEKRKTKNYAPVGGFTGGAYQPGDMHSGMFQARGVFPATSFVYGSAYQPDLQPTMGVETAYFTPPPYRTQIPQYEVNTVPEPQFKLRNATPVARALQSLERIPTPRTTIKPLLQTPIRRRLPKRTAISSTLSSFQSGRTYKPSIAKKMRLFETTRKGRKQITEHESQIPGRFSPFGTRERGKMSALYHSAREFSPLSSGVKHQGYQQVQAFEKQLRWQKRKGKKYSLKEVMSRYKPNYARWVDKDTGQRLISTGRANPSPLSSSVAHGSSSGIRWQPIEGYRAIWAED